MSAAPVVWLYGTAAERAKAEAWQEHLGGNLRPLWLGPPGDPAPDLDLGSQPDMVPALESCPLELRPKAFALLAADPPAGLDALPCPVLASGGVEGADQVLPADPDQAAEAIKLAAKNGRAWPWLGELQVNLPLTMLLGSLRPLVEGAPINLEVAIDAQALDSLNQADIALAREMLKGRRISVHLPFMDLCPASPDPAVGRLSQKRLLDAADWALEMGARVAVAHLGYLADTHRDLQAFCKRLGAMMAPLAKRLHQGGCALALENTFEPAPDVILAARQALLDAGAPQVGFCLDVGHASCFNSTPEETWWQAMGPHIIELHLHDNEGDFDWHLPPGQGRVDWARVKSQIEAMDPRPLLTIEPHREPHLWAYLRAFERIWGMP
jgi:sugar phosphate isomerase/epimerase